MGQREIYCCYSAGAIEDRELEIESGSESTFMLILTSLLLLFSCAQSDTNKQEIAATVDAHIITVSRVDRYLEQTLPNKISAASTPSAVKHAALEHLINRHIVLQTIKKSGVEAGEAKIALEISKLTDRLNEVGKRLEEYLKEIESTKTELEYEFEWQIAWRKYLSKHLNDDRLGKYYQQHRRKFDGTRMHVAHVLLEDSVDDPDDIISQAAKLKDEIGIGNISWSDCVKKHSIAKSSKHNAGEIGWVDYHGPMAPEFCRAAMKLQIAEISSPVRTKFGVHLIKCLAIEKGKIGPGDAKQAVRQDATRFLFDSMSKKNRAAAKIEFLVDWK